jgi:hypothetical protein
MGEFSTFISNSIIPFIKDSPAFLMALIIGVIFYFGYIYTEHEVRQKFTSEKMFRQFRGLHFIFFFFIGNFLLLYFLSHTWGIFGHRILIWDFKFENIYILTLAKILALIFSIIVVAISVVTSNKVTGQFTKKEAFDLFEKYPILEIIMLVAPFFLLGFSYLIFNSKTSIIVGIFTFVTIFQAVSAYAGYWGMKNLIFRYVKVYYNDIKKADIGRLRAYDGDFLEILIPRKKRKPILKIIPINKVKRFELREFSEIEKIYHAI